MVDNTLGGDITVPPTSVFFSIPKKKWVAIAGEIRRFHADRETAIQMTEKAVLKAKEQMNETSSGPDNPALANVKRYMLKIKKQEEVELRNKEIERKRLEKIEANKRAEKLARIHTCAECGSPHEKKGVFCSKPCNDKNLARRHKAAQSKRIPSSHYSPEKVAAILRRFPNGLSVREIYEKATGRSGDQLGGKQMKDILRGSGIYQIGKRNGSKVWGWMDSTDFPSLGPPTVPPPIKELTDEEANLQS